MTKNTSSLLLQNSIWSQTRRLALFFFLAFAALFCVPETVEATTGLIPTFQDSGGGKAADRFNKLRGGMQAFAVVVLLIMLVIAAIMAAMQKVTMAINVAIAAIILFGGGYIMLLIYEGLQG
jgi:Sec-independent protein secretion pathway component TatC